MDVDVPRSVLFTWTTTVAVVPKVEEETIDCSTDIVDDAVAVKMPLVELLIDRDVVPRRSRLDDRYVSAVA
jgi:hypothetical protein